MKNLNILPSEFHRPFNLDKVGRTGSQVRLEATPEECRALATRFSIPEVRFVEVLFDIISEPDIPSAYLIQGELRAEVIQPCIATLLEVHTHISATLAVRAVPNESPIPSVLTVDWAEEIDEEVYTHNQIDLGEIAAQYLALEIPVYPRHPQAADTLDALEAEPGAATSSTNPFDVLKKLKTPSED